MTEYFRYQFVCAGDLASRAIAWYSDGDFSHVDIVLDSERLLGARADSVGGAPPGVQIRSPGYANWSRVVQIAVPCSAEQKQAALGFAYDQIGKPYDKRAILAFFAARDWRSPDSWFCSELGARVGEVGGLWPSLYAPASKITPVNLALVASAVAGRVITVVR